MEDFDVAASDYDATFTNSCVGKAQRDQVWKYIDTYLTDLSENVLETNCGTGEDASRWHQRNKNIIATDISSGMVETARSKFPEIPFDTLDINSIQNSRHSFDTLFSNFGGLNCLSPQQLEVFLANANSKLDPDGHLALVIMGKKCLWERFYFSAKGKWKERNRRNTTQSVSVNLEGDSVETWYYSPKQIMSMGAENYDLVTARPIGLFVPPSYLAPAFEKRNTMFRFLKWLDKFFTHPGFGNNADHFLIILKKKK